MKSLRIIFMGTPDFAVESLMKINQSNHEIIGVVTSTDKPSGRGQKLNISAVKKYSIENNLTLFQPEKLKSKSFLESIKKLNPDVIVVVAFRFLPKEVWRIPRLGTFNLHASLLPDYRGAAPINFAIINGEKFSGVTSFLIDEQIDTGNILLQEKIEILDTDSAGVLHDKLMFIGSDLVLKTLNGLANDTIIPKIQENNSNKLAYKIFKEDCKINWSKNIIEIYNFIRGLSPYPTAFTTIKIQDQIKNLKILQGKYELIEHQKSISEIEIYGGKMKIYCKDGIYFPEIIQLEGKKIMNIKDFLNGISKNLEIIIYDI